MLLTFKSGLDILSGLRKGQKITPRFDKVEAHDTTSAKTTQRKTFKRHELSRLPHEHLSLALDEFLEARTLPLRKRNGERTDVSMAANPPRSRDMSPEAAAEEKMIDHNLRLSIVACGLAAGGFLYTPFALISVPLTLYTSADIFEDAYRALKKDRRLKASFLDSVAVSVGVLAHAYLASALAGTCYYVGRKFMLRTKDTARDRIVEIFGERPRTVWKKIGDTEVETPFEKLAVGDIVVVHAGEVVPVDGRIVDGIGALDQRLLTGEAQPAEKGVDAEVFAATVLLSGKIQVEVQQKGSDTVAAHIGDILNNTSDYQSSIETLAMQIADRSVVPTLGVGAVAMCALGPLASAAVLAANYSESLRIAAPLGMLNFLNHCLDHSLLVKDGRALELLSEVDTVVFDKTGTLTLDEPHVAAIHPLNGMPENELLTLAAAAEFRQSHPIALAIRKAADERDLALPDIDAGQYEIGYGIKVTIGQRTVHVGSRRFIEQAGIRVPVEVALQQQTAQADGCSMVLVAVDQKVAGAIELHPTIRPEAKSVIRELKQRRIRMCIISGDHEQPTRKLASELGIEDYFAEVLPEDKSNLISQLQEQGRSVCFVGDGMNDSIALKKANVSISLSGASTIATDTAQIILLDGTLKHLPSAFEIASRFRQNFDHSLLTTFGPGVLCVGGVFFLHFRVAASVALFSLSMAGGIANAMLPLRAVNAKAPTTPTLRRPGDERRAIESSPTRLDLEIGLTPPKVRAG